MVRTRDQCSLTSRSAATIRKAKGQIRILSMNTTKLIEACKGSPIFTGPASISKPMGPTSVLASEGSLTYQTMGPINVSELMGPTNVSTFMGLTSVSNPASPLV